jgi:D-amino peptidase
MATWVGAVERTGDRTIAITDADPLALYRRFVAVVALTRSLGEDV